MFGSKDEKEIVIDMDKYIVVIENYKEWECESGRKLFNFKCIIISVYFVFLLWRFISLGFYFVYVIDCFL